MKVMNEIQAAYNTLRATKMGISLQDYLALDKDKGPKAMLEKYKLAKDEYPLRISEAEQSAAGQ
jgi:hypothetical protein